MNNRAVATAFIHGRRAANLRLSTDGEVVVAKGSVILARRIDGVVVVAGGSEECECVEGEQFDVCHTIAVARLEGVLTDVEFQYADSLSMADVE